MGGINLFSLFRLAGCQTDQPAKDEKVSSFHEIVGVDLAV